MPGNQKSYAEKYNVQPNQDVYVVGKLKYSSLGIKDPDLKYPEYVVKLDDAQYYNPDGSQEGNFIDAVKDGFTYIEKKTGKPVAFFYYHETQQKPYLPIVGHNEQKTVQADELLRGADGRFGYLANGQTVKLCIHSYEYDNQYGKGIGQGLAYMEIASIDNADVKGKAIQPKQTGFDPFS